MGVAAAEGDSTAAAQHRCREGAEQAAAAAAMVGFGSSDLGGVA